MYFLHMLGQLNRFKFLKIFNAALHLACFRGVIAELLNKGVDPGYFFLLSLVLLLEFDNLLFSPFLIGRVVTGIAAQVSHKEFVGFVDCTIKKKAVVRYN